MVRFNRWPAIAQATSAVFAFVLPDAQLTPGAVGPESGAAAPLAVVCTRGYSRAIRHPYDAAWRRYRTAVFRAYGLPHAVWRDYTIDHLVPLELDGRPFGINVDGSPDLRNVWPEPKAEAVQKDAVEDELHYFVCVRRTLSLREAQASIARDWSRTRVGLPAPRPRGGD